MCSARPRLAHTVWSKEGVLLTPEDVETEIGKRLRLPEYRQSFSDASAAESIERDLARRIAVIEGKGDGLDRRCTGARHPAIRWILGDRPRLPGGPGEHRGEAI